MILLKDVTFGYTKKETILENINLNINQGDFLAIIGVNGAGKTTLINLIIENYKPTKGKVITNIKKENIGMQIQDATFDEAMRVKDYINLYVNLYNLNKKEYNHLIGMLKLETLLDKKIKKLSGGQKQKLNILIAMIHNPEILIFDELTTGLDAISRYEIRKLLKEINKKGTTIIMISHYMDEIENLCNRVVMLENKTIYFDYKLEEIYEQYNISKLDDFFAILVEKEHK